VRPNPARCPDPEVLAAFVAGNLTGAELKMVTDHLRECEDCQMEVAEGARFDREKQSVKPAPARPWWLVAAAAALIGVTLASYYWVAQSKRHDPIRILVGAAPHDVRYLEPRLSGGFRWAPLKTIRRSSNGKGDPAQMKLIGVAGEVLEKTANDPSGEAQHASGVASLLADQLADAVTTLTKAAATSSDARVWSDLAAARYAAAVENDNSQQLAQALAADDSALRIDPRLPEALFNRALILERLGLREQARAAWKQFLAVDGASLWAREAEKHLADLSTSVEFPDELQRHYDQLTRDPAAAAALAERFPQEARMWGESEILNRWALSEVAGEHVQAEAHLQLARSFGNALAHARGERLLQEAVRCIQQADANQAKVAASAHIQFRKAQKSYRVDGLADAERRFRAAAADFEAVGSPMALLARYFAANTAYDQGRIEEARRELERLLAEGSRYAAHTAQVKWQLGLIYASLGRWGYAMRVFGESIALFERLGEKGYAMTVRELLAQVYDRLGEPGEAWNHRIKALHEIGRSDDVHLRATLHAIARGAALNGDWPVSLSFLNLQMEPPRHHGDELIYVNALLNRARIHAQLGEATGALADVARARVAMTQVRDVAQLEKAEAEQLAVQAFLAPSPRESIELLSNAIDFHRAKGRRMFLPEMLLHRGRAFAASGDAQRAAADFEDGIHELEMQRTSVQAGDDRWGIFGTAKELFDEAAVLALERKDESAAFAYCERGRARELLDAPTQSVAPATQTVLHDAVALAYLVLPTRLVIFVVDDAGMHAVQETVPSATLGSEIDLLTGSAMSGDTAEFRRMATRLYEHLLSPVADRLHSGRTLVVVPDEMLSVVPFAALIDPAGRYLVEGRAVIMAPSVAAFARLSERSRSLGTPSRLLLVAGPSSRHGDSSTLTASQREGESIAAIYAPNVEVAPKNEPPELLERRAETADVIHFVGHAILPDDMTGAALVTSRREGLQAQLEVREIAAMRLRRTRVVVLAACGTARAYGRTGDTSISIARAFLVAGVPAVVATLWPIDDSPAAEFFPRIHHYLARGLPPAEALRAAQLEWAHRRDAPPGVWAAVQVIGS
jgi:CHAT domain-containing protein/TolA-binding protein